MALSTETRQSINVAEDIIRDAKQRAVDSMTQVTDPNAPQSASVDEASNTASKSKSPYKPPKEATGWNDSMMLELKTDMGKQLGGGSGGGDKLKDAASAAAKLPGASIVAEGVATSMGLPPGSGAIGLSAMSSGGAPQPGGGGNKLKDAASAAAKLPGASIVAEGVATSMGLPPGSGAIGLSAMSSGGGGGAPQPGGGGDKLKDLASAVSKLPGASIVAEGVATSMGLPPGSGAIGLSAMSSGGGGDAPAPKPGGGGDGSVGADKQMKKLASAASKLPGASIVAEGAATSAGLPPGSGSMMVSGAQMSDSTPSPSAQASEDPGLSSLPLVSSLAKLPGVGMVSDFALGLPDGTTAASMSPRR